MNLADFAGGLAAQLRRPPVPVRQQLDTLKRLGLKLTEEDEARYLADPGRYEDPAYVGVLRDLGLRGSDQILVYESEVAEAGGMYRTLFAGLARLTGGEPALTEVEEHGGQGAPWEITFRLDGRPCACGADFLGNWLDPNVIGALNGILEREGVKKRFLVLDDVRVQEQVVFFRTPQWGDFLTAGTQLRVKAD